MTVKHTVSTDALDVLGSLIDETIGRDAIHLAVEPVLAAEQVYPGQHVGFVDGGVGSSAPAKVGIVDPFLKAPVYPGQRFLLVVYPRQITSLRHVWTHPAFDNQKAPVLVVVPTAVSNDDQRESKKWLRDYAYRVDVSYDELIAHAHEYLTNGSYWNEGDRFEGEYVPEDFWGHFKNVEEGIEVPDDAGNFFSCSC